MKAPVCRLCHVEHWSYQPHRWAQGGQLQQQAAQAKARQAKHGIAVKVKRKVPA